MKNTGKRARRRQRAQESMETEILRRGGPRGAVRTEVTKVIPSSGCEITGKVRTLNSAIATVSQDTARIHQAYQQLCADNIVRDKALADLTAMMREYGTPPGTTQPYGPPTPTGRPCPMIQADMLDADGNLRAADIGITWEDNETFLHGVRVVGSRLSRPTGQEPAMSTPYPRGGGDDRSPSSMTTQPPSPETPEFRPERETHHYRIPPEACQGYRPAAPIQRFNNKSLNWPAWFRHFRAVADVHGWPKEQRALQLVSYLDETATNVAQELGDNDLYNYDILVKLLSDRFDPASRVSAFRSWFHGRSRRHHEDADAFADALTELCRVGYPQSPPELRQELIAEQFVKGQSDQELKKYLWVVIRTQKDRKLQTLIEVCTDFSSLVTPSHLHRPEEQTFAVHHHSESYTEEDEDLEDVFAIGGIIIGDLRTPLHHPAYNRCSHWRITWDTRCAQLPDNRMFSVGLQGTGHLPITIADSVLKHAPTGIFKGRRGSSIISQHGPNTWDDASS